MDLVVINDPRPRRLAFYLAEEEYLAKAYPDRDFFFAWQVNPSVIVGGTSCSKRKSTPISAAGTEWI